MVINKKGDFPSKGLKTEILKVIVLNHLSRNEGYPYALMKAVQSRRIWIVKGLGKSDFYNAINFLERQGFIRGKVVMSGAKVQKHYVLTSKGRKVVKVSEKIMFKSFLTLKKMLEER